jgi:hypothetical protein
LARRILAGQIAEGATVRVDAGADGDLAFEVVPPASPNAGAATDAAFQ